MMGYPISMLSLLTTILPLLLLSLPAHAAVCAPGQSGTVKYGSMLYQCVNGSHQGPIACVTEFGEKAGEEYRVIQRNRRGLFYPGQVANCKPHERIEVNCILSPYQNPTFSCVDPKVRECVSPKGIRLPLGTGIQEDGVNYYCAIRRYYFVHDDNEYNATQLDFAFLYNCMYDEEDYLHTHRLLNFKGLNAEYLNKWDSFCKKDVKFILPIETKFEYLSQAECMYEGTEEKHHARYFKAMFTVNNGEWAIVGQQLNVTCTRDGKLSYENCVTLKRTPVAFGESLLEDWKELKLNYTCIREPLDMYSSPVGASDE